MSDHADLREKGMQGVRRVLAVACAVVATALCARLTLAVPGSSVPQSAQTWAVVLTGALLGPRLGTGAMAAYVLIGGLGLPVFSDGGAGWDHVLGSTGGYLAGFVLASAAAGFAREAGWLRRPVPCMAVMAGAHVVILACGWGWLARSVGAVAAFEGGVAPFLIGGLWKSGLAAVIAVPVARIRDASPVVAQA